MSKSISERVTLWHQEIKPPKPLIFVSECVDSFMHLHYLYSNREAFQMYLECWEGKTLLKYVILVVEKKQ